MRITQSFHASLYFSCLQLFSALTLDKMRSEMRALRHLECERGPWLRSHQHHDWSLAPTNDGCDWVTFIVIQTICDLIEIAPADDWSHQQMMHDWVAFIVIRTICYLIEIAPADDSSRQQMMHVSELPSSPSKPYVILLRSHQQMIDRTCRWCMWVSNIHRHPNHMSSYLRSHQQMIDHTLHIIHVI